MRNKYGIIPFALNVDGMHVDGTTANDLPSDLLSVVDDCFNKNKLLYLTIIYDTFKYIGLVHMSFNGDTYCIKFDCYGGTQFGSEVALQIDKTANELYVFWTEI